MYQLFKMIMALFILFNITGCSRHDLILDKSEGQLTLSMDTNLHSIPFSVVEDRSLYYHPVSVNRNKLLTEDHQTLIYERLVANHGYAFMMSMKYSVDVAFNAKSVETLANDNDIWLMRVTTQDGELLYVLLEEGVDGHYVEMLYSPNGAYIASLYKHYDPPFELNVLKPYEQKDTDFRTTYDYKSVVMKGLVSPITNDDPF